MKEQSKKLETMIEEIDKAVSGTLSITHYYLGWELHSYREFSLYSCCGSGKINAKSFKKLIEKAYEVMKKAELPEEEQDITMKVI